MELTLENAERFQRDRKIVYVWKLGTFDNEGWERGIELVIDHNKYSKTIEANLYLVGYRGGFRQFSISFRPDRPTSARIEAAPCARYSDKALLAVEKAALSRLDQVAPIADRLLAVA